MQLTEQQRLQLFAVLQKVFVLGVMSGKGQLDQNQNPASQIEQSLMNAQKAFEEINPGTTLSAFLNQLMSEMPGK